MKSGFKSTEFYVALCGIAGITWTFIQTHCSISPTEIYAFVGIVIVYIAQRGWLKNKELNKEK